MTLPGTDLSVSRVVLGLMRIADLDDDRLHALVDAALDSGVNTFDHADIYGGSTHACERRFGESGVLTPARRERMVIASKAGIRPPGRYDFSADHLTERVEGSLRALGTDHLDLLLLHRPDPLVEPEEVAEALDRLHQQGKVRHFGVSNHTAAQIELLRTAVRQPLVVNQLQLSPVYADLITAGITAQRPTHVVAGADGLLDYCRRERITVQTWAPFQSPHGVFLGNPEYPELNRVIDEAAQRHGVTAEAIATAWILRHPARMQVVLGSTRPQRIVDGAAGASVELDREEWYAIYTAAGNPLP